MNPWKEFLDALIKHEKTEVSDEEIKEAEANGEAKIEETARKMGIVEKVAVDEKKAQQKANEHKEINQDEQER